MSAGHDRPGPRTEPLIDYDPNDIAILAETYRLLGDPTRLRVLIAILHEPVSVSDIATRVNASPSLVSHHLRLLRGARLARGRRRQKQVLYEVADEHVRHMLLDMLEHAAETDE